MITATCHVIMYRLNLVQEQDCCMGLSVSEETTKRSTLMCVNLKIYNYNSYIYRSNNSKAYPVFMHSITIFQALCRY